MKRTGYEAVTGKGLTEEYGCDFKSVKRLSNGSYFIRAECGGEGGLTPEDMVFGLEGDKLKIITVTNRICFQVIPPPPEVVRDPEFDPQGWLGLRENQAPSILTGNSTLAEAACAAVLTAISAA